MVRCSQPGHDDSPFYNFEIGDLSGSRDQGYWSSKISIFEDCPEDKLPRNVPIVIYGNVVYGHGASRSTTPVPWHYSTPLDQRFVGWILEESWTQEYMNKGAIVSFDAVGIMGLMEEIVGYPGWLHNSASPSKWTDMKNLSSDRATYFFLRNRTNLLKITDWHPSGTSRLTKYAEIADGPVYAGFKDVLWGAELIELCSDRQSCLWSEFDGNHLNDSDRVSIVTDVMEVTPADRMNQIEIPTTRDRNEIAWISIDGLAYNGTSNTPRIAYSPGYVYSQKGGGGQEEISGLIIGSQTDLEELAGRMFSVRNNPFKSISMTTQGVAPYDIAPQASIHYDELSSGTFREETIQDMDLLIRDVSDKFQSDGMGLISELKLEAIIRDHDALVGPGVPKAEDGVEGIFPPEITGPDPGDFGFDWGGDLFDWEDFAFPEDTGSPLPFSDAPAIYALCTTGLARLRKGSVNWEKVLDVSDFPASNFDMFDFGLDPWNPKNRCYIETEGTAGFPRSRSLYDVEELDGTPGSQTILTPTTFPNNSIAPDNVSQDYISFRPSINVEGMIWIEARGLNNGNYYLLKRSGYSGVWTYAFPFSGGFVPRYPVEGHHASGVNNGRIYFMIGAITGNVVGIYRSNDNGNTFTLDHSLSFFVLDSLYGLVPYDDNPNDEIAYFGSASGAFPTAPENFVRRNSDGSYTSIAPLFGGHYYTPLSLIAFEYARLKMTALLYSTSSGIPFRLATSEDGGDTWTDQNFPGSAINSYWQSWSGDPSNPNVALLFNAEGVFWVEDLHSGTPGALTWHDITYDLLTLGIGTPIKGAAVWVE